MREFLPKSYQYGDGLIADCVPEHVLRNYEMCSSLGVLVFLMCCSLNLVAKDQHLVYDGESYIYELTFDDGRISDDTMRDIWWLSPWVGEPPQGPFGIAGSVWISPQGETLVDKVFYAPWLELCFEKPGVNCDRNPEVLDKAFLERVAQFENRR